MDSKEKFMTSNEADIREFLFEKGSLRTKSITGMPSKILWILIILMI